MFSRSTARPSVSEERLEAPAGELFWNRTQVHMTAHHRHTRIFIDTEFTDLVDMHLIALAAVSEDGDEYYAEVDDYPIDSCNAFVRESVLPHLSQAPGAVMSRERLGASLRKWLDQVRGERELVVLSYDYAGDYALFVEALGDAPWWLRADNIRHRIDEEHRARFFEIARSRQHHALWDARALRAAYHSKT